VPRKYFIFVNALSKLCCGSDKIDAQNWCTDLGASTFGVPEFVTFSPPGWWRLFHSSNKSIEEGIC
jgi:hypothetical protein